jgi:hypothetical protein
MWTEFEWLRIGITDGQWRAFTTEKGGGGWYFNKLNDHELLKKDCYVGLLEIFFTNFCGDITVTVVLVTTLAETRWDFNST